MIYYQKEAGAFIITEPRPWAKKNQRHFPNYTFLLNNLPTTDIIEEWLILNRNFIKVVDNEEVSLIQNVDTNLEL